MRVGRPRHRVFSHRVDAEGLLFWFLVLRLLLPFVVLGVLFLYCSDMISDVRQVLPLVMGKVARWAQR